MNKPWVPDSAVGISSWISQCHLLRPYQYMLLYTALSPSSASIYPAGLNSFYMLSTLLLIVFPSGVRQALSLHVHPSEYAHHPRALRYDNIAQVQWMQNGGIVGIPVVMEYTESTQLWSLACTTVAPTEQERS